MDYFAQDGDGIACISECQVQEFSSPQHQQDHLPSVLRNSVLESALEGLEFPSDLSGSPSILDLDISTLEPNCHTNDPDTDLDTESVELGTDLLKIGLRTRQSGNRVPRAPHVRHSASYANDMEAKAIHAGYIDDRDWPSRPLDIRTSSPVLTSGGPNCETQHNGFENVIDLALSSGDADGFDLPALHDAFLNFFEKGEVSVELDSYLDKVLVSEGLESLSFPSRPDIVSKNRRNSQYCRQECSSASEKLRQRRLRNNEASRRSRASNKALLEELIRSVERLQYEKRAMSIWLRHIRSTAAECRRLLHRAHFCKQHISYPGLP